MGLGTFFSGDVKCDWCGRYIKNTDGGLGGALGLDIVKRGIAASYKHYCSRQCKLAAEQAEQNSTSGNSDVSQSSYVSEDNVETSTVENNTVKNMQFSNDPNEILNQMQNLITMTEDLQTLFGRLTADSKAKAKIIKSQMEFGLMKLRSLGKNAEADFFEKKMTGGILSKV